MNISVPQPPPLLPMLNVDPGLVAEAATAMVAASAQIDDLGSFATGSARIATWTGAGGSAYHEATALTGETADEQSLALRDVARLVDEHADTLTRLQAERKRLESEREQLLVKIADLNSRAAAATSAQQPVLTAEAIALSGWVDTCRAAGQRWCEAVNLEETAMVAAFQRVLTTASVHATYAGQTDPADRAIASMPASGTPPRAVNRWWRSLDDEARNGLIAALPTVIGNLNGLPAAVRDMANRIALARDLASLESRPRGTLTGDEKQQLANARSAAAAIDHIEAQHDPQTRQPIVAQLYEYDPKAFRGDGRIAVSAGDLDHADNVAVIVPGFSTDGADAPHYAESAVNLYEAARHLDPTESTASMFWIGYDAPSDEHVAADGMAEEGGRRLDAAVDGLRGSRPDPAHLSVIGHSYGSTTTALGASDNGLAVDELVLVGSPGAGDHNTRVEDLGVDPLHVWVGRNSLDPVAVLGNHGSSTMDDNAGAGLGTDPADASFGGQRFTAEDDSIGIKPWENHTKYFDHDSESLANISHVVTGDVDGVQRAPGVADPWYWKFDDPESDRQPTHPSTQ